MPRRLHLVMIVVTGLFLGSAVLAGDTDRMEAIFSKQSELREQYEKLNRLVLFPAGRNREFDAFRLKNPAYYKESYSRSRTASVVRDLLAQHPDYLRIFETCGLSQGGEYMCRHPRCPVHAQSTHTRTAAAAALTLDPLGTLKFLGALVGGMFLFVFAAGLGKPLCAWLDRKFPTEDEAGE